MRCVIGDIHGCYKTFRKLIENKIQLGKDDTLYLVGDYIDRGPRSNEVINYIIGLADNGYDVQPIRGNHEEILLDAFRNQSADNFLLWMMNGAERTLESYGIESYDTLGSACLNELPENHISFFRRLPYYIELDDFIIVHAGINFQADEPYKDYRSMVWCRDCENDLRKSGRRVIVHGHTPIPLSEINRKEINKGSTQINVDAGCVYKGSPGMGNLVAFDLDSYKMYSEENIDF